METGSEGQTGASGVPGVPVDLGLDEGDVEVGGHGHSGSRGRGYGKSSVAAAEKLPSGRACRVVGGSAILGPVPPPASRIRRLAAGVVVRERDEGLSVASPFVWTDWHPPTPPSPGRVGSPGTAVLFEDVWFEVRRVERNERGWRYELGRWESGEALRTTSELSEAACETTRERCREAAALESRQRALWWLVPLVGLLPAETQRRLERETGLSAATATWVSAAPLLAFAFLEIVLGWAKLRGLQTVADSALARIGKDYLLLWPFLAADSLTRLYMGLAGQPIGSMFVVPLVRLFGPRNSRDDGARDPGTEAGIPDSDRPVGLDRVRVPDGPGADVEVVSDLPKEHWRPGVTGILVEGVVHTLEETREEHAGDVGRRWVFRLVRADESLVFRHWGEFRPEEARELLHERHRAASATFVETWAHLWGLLDEPTQLALARGYDYDPWKRTWTTIVVVGLLGLGHLVVGAAGVVQEGSATAGSVFLVGAVLSWESLLRWVRFRAGVLHPSLAAVVLAPLVHNALRWAPPEGAAEQVAAGRAGGDPDGPDPAGPSSESVSSPDAISGGGPGAG